MFLHLFTLNFWRWCWCWCWAVTDRELEWRPELAAASRRRWEERRRAPGGWWSCQEDGDLEVDLFAGFDREEEAEERDGVDEETGKDEVDDVEETAAGHVDRESDVGVWLWAAGVHLTESSPTAVDWKWRTWNCRTWNWQTWQQRLSGIYIKTTRVELGYSVAMLNLHSLFCRIITYADYWLIITEWSGKIMSCNSMPCNFDGPPLSCPSFSAPWSTAFNWCADMWATFQLGKRTIRRRNFELGLGLELVLDLEIVISGDHSIYSGQITNVV